MLKNQEFFEDVTAQMTQVTNDLCENFIYTPKWDKSQCAWRHTDDQKKRYGIILYLLTKLMGVVSTQNAVNALVKQGFLFQSGILIRSIIEAHCAIVYVLPDKSMYEIPNDTIESNYPTQKQYERIEKHFEETWDDPQNPYDNSHSRSLPMKNLATAFGRFIEKDAVLSSHDVIQTTKQLLRYASDYTHMAYPQLMELLEGSDGYKLAGKQNENFDFSAINDQVIAHTLSQTLGMLCAVVILILKVNEVFCDICDETQKTKLLGKIELLKSYILRLNALSQILHSKYPVNDQLAMDILKKFK